MSQGVNGDEDLGRRNAWLYYLLVGGSGIVLVPLNVALHAELWPELASFLLLLATGTVSIVTAMRSRKPRTLRVRPGEFVAPPAFFQLAANAATTPPAVGVLLNIVYDDDDWGVFTWMLFAATVGLAYVMVYSVVMLARGTGRMSLRPDGVSVVDGFATYEVPWQAIMTGPLPTVFGVGRLGILWPELVRSRGLFRRRNPQRIQLQLQSSAVHREFLHDAINHYLNHPEDRPAIGTQAGLAALVAGLPA